jgi:dinuclear metal center YbgI/SA1388 family protein
MLIKDVYNAMNTLAPFCTAEEWDNCGLLLGSLDMPVKKVLVCLDVTNSVVDKAIEINANLIISHHPVIFDPIKTLDYNSKIAKLVKNNVAVISAHTNLDIAKNGVNDTLCKMLNLKPVNETPSLVKICECDGFENAREFAQFVKEKINSNELLFTNTQKPIKKVAVCGGSGSSFLDEVINANVDAYLTGELKHNVVLDLYDNNISAVMGGHFSTEIVVVKPLVEALCKMLPEIEFVNALQTAVAEVL